MRRSPSRACVTLFAGVSLALVATLHGCGGGGGDTPSETPASELLLHVPSPEWQDQIIYFVMTDRFNDGDPSNSNQGAGEFNPADNARYSGGDLRGIEQKIDYIRGLGATTVWITPPVANQWWDPLVNYGGYHGYWAENFMQVDRHVGTLDDYKRLSSSLHKAGMYLVQDIVVNHTGNFFRYDGGHDPADPTRFLVMNPNSRPVSAPTQAPFHQNDPRIAAHRDAAIYHWTPSITNYQDESQLQTWQLSDLDDLNTDNPVVRDALRTSYNHWIREVGVDGFRIDTVLYATPEYFKDFLRSTNAAAPGVLETARATGRQNFLAFGEGFAIDRAYEVTQQRRIDAYMTDPATGEDILPGMINFPLYGTAGDVFARGRPTAELGHRVRQTMALHKRPHLMPSFLDNHDVDRFLRGGTQAGLKQNLLMMMTLPGIPVVYYGTEQAFTEQRGAMFRAGFGSGGQDRFDTGAPLYRYIASVSELRKGHRVFSRGTPTVLKENAAAPGAFAYRMDHDGQRAFVVFNTADRETLLDNLDTGLPEGTRLRGVFAIDGTAQDVTVGAGGRLTMTLPARAGFAWLATNEIAAVTPPAAVLTMSALADAVQPGDFTVTGTASGAANFKLVVDGDLANARTVTPAADGTWRATVDTGAMIDARMRHAIVAWHPASNATSASGSFFVDRPWVQLAQAGDPAGDDTGPGGAYRYPTDASWGTNRQLDLRNVTVFGSGGAMRIDVQTNQVTTTWNPANGFDHVAFTIFIELPGQPGGATVMPQQNSTLPGGMRWHYRLRAHGWSNALFSSAGASATHEGTPVSPAAGIEVDRDTNAVRFILTDAALGRPASLAGAKVYVTTWDYDGGYRGLVPAAQQWQFSGGNGSVDPLVMDASSVIALP